MLIPPGSTLFVPERVLPTYATLSPLRRVVDGVRKFGWLALIFAASAVNTLADANEPVPTDNPSGSAKIPIPTLKHDLPRNWSLQLGVAYIAANNIGDILTGKLGEAEGDGEGEIYSFTLNWVAHRFSIECADLTLNPQFEPYARLTLVDENRRSPFLDSNAGVGFRWVDFPWNRWLKTTIFTGVGLSYSSKVFAADRARHPGDDRSHLKFDWPLEITFGLPRWPEHQLYLFNDHQSGGHIFDRGGVNSLGIGYRFEF